MSHSPWWPGLEAEGRVEVAKSAPSLHRFGREWRVTARRPPRGQLAPALVCPPSFGLGGAPKGMFLAPHGAREHVN